MKKKSRRQLSFRIEEDDYETIKRAASLLGQSVQDFLNDAVLVQTRKIIDGQDSSNGKESILDSPLLRQQLRLIALGVELQMAALSQEGKTEVILEADKRVREWIADLTRSRNAKGC